jgi:AraC-like DNA-binding protein
MKCADAGRTRLIHARTGVGVTAEIIQREALRFSRLTIDQPTLIVVRHGVKILTSADTEWKVRSGDAVVLAKGCRFDVINRLDANAAYEASWLVFEPSLLASFAAVSPRMSQSACALARVGTDFMETFTRGCNAIRDTERISHAIAQHRVQEILLWLDRHGVNLATLWPSAFAERVRALLTSAPYKRWTAALVARQLHTSEATLRRHLAAEGTRLSDLLVDVRMSHALLLLQSTDSPVGHIARDVGYESASRFAVRFRKRFGFAPTAIRGHRHDDPRISAD